MKKYLMIKFVFCEEIHPDVYALMSREYESASREMDNFAAALDAELFVEDTVNFYGAGRSYALVEHNFPLTRAEKDNIIQHISHFFTDGEVEERELKTFNVLSAVRFLQTEGELFEL